MTTSRLRILDPTVAPTIEHGQMAPRVDSLDGKVVGLYHNGKLNAARLLDLVAEQLCERATVKEFVRGSFNAGRVLRREEWEGIEQCDTVILGIGD